MEGNLSSWDLRTRPNDAPNLIMKDAYVHVLRFVRRRIPDPDEPAVLAASVWIARPEAPALSTADAHD
ncbi:MAG: hypothetical protein A3J67_01565 [Parcubacteria group bacterium RIFCSPHIGHO2_02_FULL_48_10b]|nr:MAG: hypothetical protein A3J67_01565 [Parcubacteria group bacterium RIFCSPHIGHO2_02_FULL_48_10b]